MNCFKKLWGVVLGVCIMGCMNVVNGQIAINIGYTGSTFLDNKLKKPINAFNAQLPNQAKPLKKMNYQNGIHVDISTYGIPVNVGLEYNGTFVSLAAKRLISSSSISYNYIFNYSNNAAGLALSLPIKDMVSIGGTVFYNFYAFRNLVTLDNERRTLIKDKGLSIKPWVDVRISHKEDRVGASLRFFANLPLYDTQIAPIYQALDPSNQSNATVDDYVFRMHTVGISFILNNRR